jgi:uncharacterized protein with HEPN domain
MHLEMRFLEEAVAKTTRAAFLEDEVLKRAFCRSLEIIGEAARQVPDEVRARQGALEITGSPGVSGIRFQPSASGGTHRASS